MNTGQYISGVGHLALIGWVLIGGVLFRPKEPPFEFANVSVISGEEFAAMQEAAAPLPSETPAEPAPPSVQPDPSPDPEPEPEPQPAPEPVPQPEPPPAPEPPPVPEAQPEPPPVQDAGSTVLTNEAPVPTPQQADVVAPDESPAPPEDVAEAPLPQEAAEPDEAEVVEVPVEEPEPAAPQQTTTAIITEADRPAAGGGALAPERSLKPRTRPERLAAAEPMRQPERPPEPARTPEPERAPDPPPPAPQPDTSVEDAIAAAAAEAVAAALAGADSGPTSETGGTGRAASGPPLTAGERDAFRVAVSNCWVIDPGSESSRVTVTVAFGLDTSGRVAGNIALLASSGGSDTAVSRAFESARRAILRCQGGGFPLPAEKYDQWKEVEMTFNPDGMRIQ